MLKREHRTMGTGAALAACVAVVVGCSASAGLACDGPSYTRAEINPPMVVNADGSFLIDNYVPFKEYGNSSERLFGASSISGHAISDFGKGRVAQRIVRTGFCSHYENLIFVDCNSAEAISVDGLVPPEYLVDPSASGIDGSIDLILRPKGPISLGSKTSVDEVEAISKKHGFTYSRDVLKGLKSYPRKQRYDPFNGCKIFYPGSKGATG